jgi:arginine N-succinyltransferase
MLSESARSAIGVPHPSGNAAMRMLENEGFSSEGYVDIFDGGPTMTAKTDKVASVADAREAALAAVDCETGEPALVAAGHLASFRCAYGVREERDGGVAIDSAAAGLLGVGAGEKVWSVAR